MTRLEKLLTAEKEILALQVDADPDLFSTTLPQKMEAFLALCYFEDVNSEKLHHYFDQFVAIYEMDIAWSRNMKKDESWTWQTSFLRTCKDQTHNLLNVIVRGFEHLAGNKDRLYIEED